MQTLLTFFFFSKNISIYAIFNDQSFNDTLTNDIVSFEQLGPEHNDFNNSESLCYSNASHQVSAPSNVRFGRICLVKIFKMATVAAILDIRAEQL